ncbi:hypothetical protein [Dactylococcopsis salina]|uniref:hypothetical protein n=1 Tax=Dactylococcopsis salina TaxID=292566 RepID=UPI0002F943FF|nr:hypothetical protein [Dactylococcopsis salina]
MNGDSLAVNGNRIDGGSDDDQLLVSQNDRAFGGSGNDVILSGEGENRLYGGLEMMTFLSLTTIESSEETESIAFSWKQEETIA